MRMRTLPEAIKILKEQDPETALTLTALRRKVKRGEIPAVMVGVKSLIDVDRLGEYLAQGMEKKECTGPIGIVRPIPENLTAGHMLRRGRK